MKPAPPVTKQLMALSLSSANTKFQYYTGVLKFDSESIAGVILWDIDGTLMRTKRPNSTSPHKNVLRKRGYPFDPSVAGLSGRTDYEVFQELTKGELGRDMLLMAFEELDPESNKLDEASTFDLCPGVYTTLRTLSYMGWTHGILTGNTQNRLVAKLEKVGIKDRFSKELLFGCEFGDSREMIAIRASKFLQQKNLSKVVVLGDTPSDIAAARLSTLQVISVATGKYSLSELSSHKPDLLLRDLSADADILIAFLKSLSM
jgi:phosphoglycolate phosphatase-like HAD superfamily hydrolase